MTDTPQQTTNLQIQLQQKNDQLAAVREISQAVAGARDLDDTLDLITRRTTEIMHVDSCSIYLYNETGDKLILKASTGLNQAGIGLFWLPKGSGLTGWAAENREIIAVDNVFSDPRFYRILGSGESKFPSLMAVPLISQNKVIGAANVQTTEKHTFADDEVELFGLIAELAATALGKAQLVQAALVQEMHHRVKNNLQTIAMLLRLQIGQEKDLSPKDVLNESINRVLSIATVHEILSEAVVDEVDVLELIRRVANTVSSNMVNPAANITITVEGETVDLPSQRATALALVANELLQNALEHGMANRKEGKILVRLTPEPNRLRLNVFDNGRGLSPDFNPDTDLGLGLTIVRTSIIEDMHGRFWIRPNKTGRGTATQVAIPL